MSGDAVYTLTPVGRLVMGDAFVANDKDATGRLRIDKSGAPKVQYFIGIAVLKTDPAWAEFWAAVTGVAARDWPGGQFNHPNFAWKIVDGDHKYPDRSECAGCYIIRASTGFAPVVVNSNNQQIADPSQCKRGDYVRAYVSIKGNDDSAKFGVYVSHTMIQHVGFGEAISSGPSAAEVFAQPAAMPVGSSVTPVAPALAPAPVAAPVYAVPNAPTLVAPVVPIAPSPAPALIPAMPIASPSNVQPHPAILQPPAGPVG